MVPDDLLSPMKQPTFDPGWPESWKSSYRYDLEERFSPVSLYGYAYAYRRRLRQTLELMRRSVDPPATVLDIAAAQGNFSLALAELGYRVTWNDLRGELIGYVKLKWTHGDIRYLPGNVFELDLGETFDAVLITEIIEHVAHPDDFLRKAARLIKPGGHIVMTTPNGEYFVWKSQFPRFSDCPDPSQFEKQQFKPNSDGHIFLLHQDEIRALAAGAGLEVVEQSLFTNPLTNGHTGFHRILPFLPTGLVEALENFTECLPLAVQRRIHNGTGVLLRRPAVEEGKT